MINWWRWLLTAASILCVTGRADTVWRPLTSGEHERLAAGEVVLLQREAGMNRGGAHAAMLVHAPAERIWSVITSCENALVYAAGMEYCEVLEQREDFALTRHVVDKSWFMPEIDYTFETRFDPYRRMDFELIEGNLDALHGSWTFEKTRHGLLVRHDITIDPQLPAPRWLVRRNISDDLPDTMRCIRALAEGSASEDMTEADREACPGEPADLPQYR